MIPGPDQIWLLRHARRYGISQCEIGGRPWFGSSLGGRLHAPHGLITAQLAPYVMQENVLAAREAGRADVLNRYRQLACILTGRMNAEIVDGIDWTKRTLKRLNLPSVTEYGFCDVLFDEVAEDALLSNSIKGNPLPLNKDRLMSILNQICQCKVKDSRSQDDLYSQEN